MSDNRHWVDLPYLDGKPYLEVYERLERAVTKGQVVATQMTFNLADMIVHDVRVEPNYLYITRQSVET